MFKFKGFKASLNFGSAFRKKDSDDAGPELSIVGSYRVFRDDYLGNGNFIEATKRQTNSMVTPDTPVSTPLIRQIKSTSDLTVKNVKLHAKKSNEVSTDPKGGSSNVRNSTDIPSKPQRRSKSQDKDREAKKIEKQKFNEQRLRDKERQRREKHQMEEQKKLDKIAAEEQAKLLKRKKDEERKAEKAKSKVKQKAPPKPVPRDKEKKPKERMNPLAQTAAQSITPEQAYSTNTLESSISKTSGPPPYTEIANVVPNQQDLTGNTSFAKKVDDSSSWDLITQHRQEINRPVHKPREKKKQIVLDLNYKLHEQTNKDVDEKSEA